jgi:hypothetical protein
MVKPMRFIFAIIVAAGFWSALGHADDAKPLTGTEITALLSGNTVKGSNFSEYYDPSGAVRGSDKGAAYTGSWRVANDALCVDFASYNYKECITISAAAAGKYEFKDSKDTHTNTIVKGNPGNL